MHAVDYDSGANGCAHPSSPPSARLRDGVVQPSRAMTPDASPTDAALLGRIAAQDSAALGEFYDRHGSVLFALAYRILNAHKEAEDLLQEVLLSLWEKSAMFDPTQGRPLGWVIVLTRRKAIDRLRAAQRRARLAAELEPEFTGNPPAHPASAVEAVGADEQAALVRSALAGLPADQRRAIDLAFFGGLSQTEVAAELNEALGTVKARIRRGMLRLREELGPRLC